jgi:hypothetical protein
MPERRQLRRRENASVHRRQRVAFAALDPPAVERENALADRRAALDEAVLSALGTQLGRDQLARCSVVARHADVDEEERPVLQLQPAAKLRVGDHRTVAYRGMRSSLSRKPLLALSEQMPGEALEQQGRRRYGELQRHVTATGGHHGEQSVHGRFALVLEAIERLGAADELAILLQAEDRAGATQRLARAGQPAVRIGRAKRSLDEGLRSGRAAQRQPGRSGRRAARGDAVVNLQRHRRLTECEATPPSQQKPLVQRLEHLHDRLGGGCVGPIGLNPQAHVAPASARDETRDEQAERQHSQPRSHRLHKRSQYVPTSAPDASDRSRPDLHEVFGRDRARAAAQGPAQAAIETPGDQSGADEDRDQAEQPPQQQAKHLELCTTARSRGDRSDARVIDGASAARARRPRPGWRHACATPIGRRAGAPASSCERSVG